MGPRHLCGQSEGHRAASRLGFATAPRDPRSRKLIAEGAASRDLIPVVVTSLAQTAARRRSMVRLEGSGDVADRPGCHVDERGRGRPVRPGPVRQLVEIRARVQPRAPTAASADSSSRPGGPERGNVPQAWAPARPRYMAAPGRTGPDSWQMLLDAFSRRMSCSRALSVMTKARRLSTSVVMPTSRPGYPAPRLATGEDAEIGTAYE